MKALNRILNLFAVCGILLLVFMFFPSIDSYFNKLIDKNSNLSIVDQLPKIKDINLGELISDSSFNINKNIGFSGEEYTFNSEFYPYYDLLDETDKSLYKQVYANALNMNKDFTPISDISRDEVSIVVESVMYDHPELFWLDNSYSYKYNTKGICLEINLKFNGTYNNMENSKLLFDRSASDIIEQAKLLGSDLEKEKYVHDRLVDSLIYDTDSSNNQSAYSALVQHTSVCAGEAKAFQYIMMELGIPCYYVTGESSEDHAWNIIKIDDIYYNVDLTWDSTGSDSYEFFNKSDYEISDTHERSTLSSMLPKCINLKNVLVDVD